MLEEQLVGALAIAEAELVESRREFQSILKCLSGLFYRCQLAAPWKMSFISHGVEELTGYTAKEIEQKNGWTEIMLPNDIEAVGRK
jgi:PAS domain-containing protein